MVGLEGMLTFTCSRVSTLTDAKIEFGLVPKEHWVQPDWIDEEKASAARKDMVEHNVIYGGQSSVLYILSRILKRSHRKCLVPQYVPLQLWRECRSVPYAKFSD